MVVSTYNLHQFQVPEYDFPLFSIRSIKIYVIKGLMTNGQINLIHINITRSVDRVVGIATVVRAGRSWVAIRARDKKIFSLPQHPERSEDSIIIFKGQRRLFPEEAEGSDRTADHSI